MQVKLRGIGAGNLSGRVAESAGYNAPAVITPAILWPDETSMMGKFICRLYISKYSQGRLKPTDNL